MTKHEVKVAEYWQSFFPSFIDRGNVEVKKMQKKNKADIQSSWLHKLGQ